MNVVISIPSFSNSVNPLLSNFKDIGITDFPIIEVEKLAVARAFCGIRCFKSKQMNQH